MKEWYSIVTSVDDVDIYIVFLMQKAWVERKTLEVYRAKKKDFTTLCLWSQVHFDQIGWIISFQSFLIHDKIYSFCETKKDLGYLEFSVVDQSLQNVSFRKLLDGEQNGYVIEYLAKQSIFCFSCNFSIILSEKLEASSPESVRISPIKPLITTEVGNLNNFVDFNWESIIRFVPSNTSNSFVLLSKSLVSSLPSVYWVEWDFSQNKAFVQWKRSLYYPQAELAFLSETRQESNRFIVKVDCEDLAVIHNQTSLFIMNRKGIVHEFTDLGIGSIASFRIWEYINQIVTLLVVNFENEFFMIQIEINTKFTLQIIHKYTMYSLNVLQTALNSLVPSEMEILFQVSSRNRFVAITKYLDFGWGVVSNECTIKEFGHLELSRIVNRLPVNVASPPVNSLTNVAILHSENHEKSLLVKWNQGCKTRPELIAELEMGLMDESDLELSKIDSIGNNMDAQISRDGSSFFLLQSRRLRVASIMKISICSEKAKPTIDSMEIEENCDYLQQIYRVKESNYLLLIFQTKIILLPFSRETFTPTYTVPLKDFASNILSNAQDFLVRGSYQILPNILALQSDSFVSFIDLDVTNMLDYEKFIRIAETRNIDCSPLASLLQLVASYERKILFQLHLTDSQSISIECYSIASFPLPLLHSATIKSAIPRDEVILFKVIIIPTPVEDDRIRVGLLILTRVQIYYREIVYTKSEAKLSLAREGCTFWNSSSLASITHISSTMEKIVLIVSLKFSDSMYIWQRVQIDLADDKVAMFNFDSITDLAIMSVSNESDKYYSSSNPVFISELSGLYWLQHMQDVKTGILRSYLCFSKVNSTPDTDVWIDCAKIFKGKVLTVIQSRDLRFYVLLTLSRNEEDDSQQYEMILVDSRNLRLEYSVLLNEKICPQWTREFLELIEHIDITLTPVHHMTTINHVVGQQINSDNEIFLYIHVIMETPFLYELDEVAAVNDQQFICHYFSFLYHSKTVDYLDYLYLPVPCPQNENSFSRSSHSIPLLFPSGKIDVALCFPSGYLMILSWQATSTMAEVDVDSGKKIKAPMMIGAYSMKTESLIRKEKQHVTKLGLSIRAHHYSEFLKGFHPKRYLLNSLSVQLVDESVLLLQPLYPSGLLLTRIAITENPQLIFEDIGCLDCNFIGESSQFSAFTIKRKESTTDSFYFIDNYIYLLEFPSNEELISKLERSQANEENCISLNIVILCVPKVNPDYFSGDSRNCSNPERASSILNDQLSIQFTSNALLRIIKTDAFPRPIGQLIEAAIQEKISAYHKKSTLPFSDKTIQEFSFQLSEFLQSDIN